jgi:hypothetical protein
MDVFGGFAFSLEAELLPPAGAAKKFASGADLLFTFF